MADTVRWTGSTSPQRSARPETQQSGTDLADILERVLDKGIVIDVYVRVSLVGIELLTIDARIVIASVDTYLRFAEATNRLDLESKSKDLQDLVGGTMQSGAQGKTKGALEGAKEAILGDGDDDGDDKERPRRSSSSRSSSSARPRKQAARSSR